MFDAGPGNIFQQPAVRRLPLEGFLPGRGHGGEVDGAFFHQHRFAVAGMTAGEAQHGLGRAVGENSRQRRIRFIDPAFDQLIAVGCARSFDLVGDIAQLHHGVLGYLLGDEGAVTAAAHHQALVGQHLQRPVDGHAGGAEEVHEGMLRRQPSTGRQSARQDRRGDGAADLAVDRTAPVQGKTGGVGGLVLRRHGLSNFVRVSA